MYVIEFTPIMNNKKNLLFIISFYFFQILVRIKLRDYVKIPTYVRGKKIRLSIIYCS